MKFLVMDCEACNCAPIDGQLDVKNGQAYDLGGKVIDEFGNEYDEFSCVIEDVFFGMEQAMNEAYFADKIPQYLEDMRMSKRKIVNIYQLRYLVHELCKKHNIKCIVAHNAWFDVTVLNSTLRYHTKSDKRYFLPYGTKVLDTMKMAKKVLDKDKKYREWCEENNYMTNHANPRPRYTAEILWRWFSGDNNFCEEHTGLADVEIESKIMVKCLEALRSKASENYTR